MDRINALLETLKQGGKQSHLNLTMIPLLSSNGGEPDYLTLEEGLSQGLVVITEICTGGSVPELKLINKSPHKVLIVDGEELIGAKQNRIVNASFLIAGNTEVIIPVSCVEQGRWNYRSKSFASGERPMPSTLRFKNQKAVAVNLKEGAGYRSNQGMIWEELAEKSIRMNVRSETGAMADLFEGQKDKLGEYLKAFHLVDFQIGGIFAINGKVVGLECFFHHKTFEKFFKKLIQSYALDAIDMYEEPKTDQVATGDIRRFMEGVRNAPKKGYPSLGLGENIRPEGHSFPVPPCYITRPLSTSQPLAMTKG
jgi:hypothetical protein